MPIKTLKGINRPKKEKIALSVVFGAGLFATAMSCARLQSVYMYNPAIDPFRDVIPVCTVEPVRENSTLGYLFITVFETLTGLFSS